MLVTGIVSPPAILHLSAAGSHFERSARDKLRLKFESYILYIAANANANAKLQTTRAKSRTGSGTKSTPR